MRSVLKNYNLDIICITDKEFIDILNSDDIENSLNDFINKKEE